MTLSPVRIKFCGITRPKDAVIAADLGVDAIGLVFYPASPRAVDSEQAQQISAALPPFISCVGLFVDAEAEAIDAVLEQVSLDMIQFHGNESPSDCKQYGIPYLKAVAMRDDVNLQSVAEAYADASGLLLDTWSNAAPGGTGQSFDWDRVPPDLALPVVIAGGLNPDNVAEAIQATKPWGVDVSGGIESAKGIKDAAKMAAFVQEVKNV